MVQKSCNRAAAERLVDLIDSLKGLPLTDKTYPSITLDEPLDLLSKIIVAGV